MNKIIVITGPTGVGKTKLSIEIAKRYNGEIINADSMQIYKELDIGTAKIKESEKEGIPHHLFDIKNVEEDYSIYDYQKDARKKIDDILKRNKTPILVGGTGLYIKACLYDYLLIDNNLNNQYDDLTNEDIYNKLINLFPNMKIDKNNRRRLVRALNYYMQTGNLITLNKTEKLLYNTIFIGLTCERSKLYDIINKRVDKMISNGLINEVYSFYQKGIKSKALTGGIGYKELYKYFANECSLEESIELIKKNSRHYAKRQYTFLNNQMNINWINVNFDNFNETIDNAINIIKEE